MKTEIHAPYRFGDAARAMKALLDDPDDTAQAFRIIEALSGGNGVRNLRRMRRTRTGQNLLRDKPRLIERLRDREGLRALPAGSLGREYLRFLESEGISAEGLEQASIEGRDHDVIPEDLSFLRDRMRDTHDLWHTLTGYKGDLLGEASLLAFSFAQTKNPGVGFIVLMALLRGREPQVRKMIATGLLRGAMARWLVPVEWEALLGLPIDVVRRNLRVGPPPSYEPVRTMQYVADRVAA